MGIIDRWINKTKKEQLQAADEKSKFLVTDEKQQSKKSPGRKNNSKQTEKKSAGVYEQPNNIVTNLHSNAHKVLLSSLVSEKAAIGESKGKYVFFVHRTATKQQVKKAIKEIYGADVRAVNMINLQGKSVRFGRFKGRRTDTKKAIITLNAGASINIHAGV